MQLRACASVALLVSLGAVTLRAQGPWTVTIRSTTNPLPIGSCGLVLLKAIDPKSKGTPHNPAGHYVSSIADFDMTVESAVKTDVVARSEGKTLWSVCACQSATVGAQATITATYPAKALPPNSRFPGIAFKSQGSFTIAAARGGYNPPGRVAPRAKSVTASGLPTALAPPVKVATSPVSAPTALTAPALSGSLTPPISVSAPVAVAPQTVIGPEQILAPLAVATGSTASGPVLAASARMTNFKPSVNGFQFVNTFTNVLFGSPLNAVSSGLCGGMTYAVLDYYYSGMRIPNQNYRPANGTTLQTYLYGRQSTSLVQNADRWIELTLNPGGSRTLEFFNWGISGQLTLLRSYIDRGVPVTLGLKGSEGNLSQSHQVLAIGYDVGRYLGDLGQNKEDVKIYVFDPNFPNMINTLVPDLSKLEYYYAERPQEHWSTYFVDGKYSQVTPPNLPNVTYPNDSLIHELLFEFDTGADDMRGGADHVDVKLILKDNTTQTYQNISQTGRWVAFYRETVRVILSQPVAPDMIRAIQFSTNATQGIDGDNWDMAGVAVTGVGGNFSRNLRIDRAGPYRFPNGGIPYIVFIRCCFW